VFEVRFRSQEDSHMMFLLSRAGLRPIQGKGHRIGAQTERRGLVGPVKDLLGGETSPADYFFATPTSGPPSVQPAKYSKSPLSERS
jgi:hypothetical protein